MIRNDLGRSRVRESRTLGSVGAKPNGLATRPSPRDEKKRLTAIPAAMKPALARIQIIMRPSQTLGEFRRIEQERAHQPCRSQRRCIITMLGGQPQRIETPVSGIQLCRESIIFKTIDPAQDRGGDQGRLQ
jgi:hypothetical protein